MVMCTTNLLHGDACIDWMAMHALTACSSATDTDKGLLCTLFGVQAQPTVAACCSTICSECLH